MAPASGPVPAEPCARFADVVGTELLELTGDPDRLDSGGRWAVVVTYEGALTAARFGSWRPGAAADVAGPWIGPAAGEWQSSMGQDEYESAVRAIRDSIGRGDVYQASLCRVLTAQLPDATHADLGGLHALLARGNPAPYQGFVRLPGLQVATASPELFLQRDRDAVRTGPIKGTGRTSAELESKDRAENVMIVDLMRNDLSRVCLPGTVHVPRLLALEHHPGLVHLVSDVAGHLRPATTWAQLFGALLPPGSVSGAPKASAVRILQDLEPQPRGPYSGAIGWIDADAGTAVLAVGIRTFWMGEDRLLRFGTGAGITWGSQPRREWRETQLKAAHLLQVAAGRWP